MSACVAEAATALLEIVATSTVWLGVFGLGIFVGRSGTERCDVVVVNNSISNTLGSVERFNISSKH